MIRIDLSIFCIIVTSTTQWHVLRCNCEIFIAISMLRLANLRFKNCNCHRFIVYNMTTGWHWDFTRVPYIKSYFRFNDGWKVVEIAISLHKSRSIQLSWSGLGHRLYSICKLHNLARFVHRLIGLLYCLSECVWREQTSIKFLHFVMYPSRKTSCVRHWWYVESLTTLSYNCAAIKSQAPIFTFQCDKLFNVIKTP